MTYRILVVEDSRTQAMRIQLELRRHGLEVEVANTGPNGLQAARNQHPDAVVLDVDLPELDGYAVCRALKEDPQTSHIPIVMLTRYDDAKNALAGLETGAIDYIPKDSYAEHNLIESLRQLGLL
ncbi:MAG: response regulator [Chloroflexaceae bacterium]|nr:response regulator [Chloroflexaceae bacterium]